VPDPASVTVAETGERALVDRLRARVGSAPPSVIVGIGDDAAVVEPERGTLDVLTTDSLIEHVHFRRDWTAPGAVGHKAVAVNLSDLAAMGATPRALLLSLALPPALTLADFDALVGGAIDEARAERAALVGGNLARSPGPLVIDVTAVGSVHRRRILKRHGVRPGDELYVTGAVGAAAAGLAMLEAGTDRAALDETAKACVEAYERPVARVRCGRLVASSRAATAAIDLSDGLAEAAVELARASGTGVRIEASAVPVHPGARAWSERAGRDPVADAVAGGEDYELLFAVPPRRRRGFLAAVARAHGLAVTRVGVLTAEPGAWLDRASARSPLSGTFRHFQDFRRTFASKPGYS
jgi:thiamine-monophosphate kinase